MANKKTKIRIMMYAIDTRGHQHEVEDYTAEVAPDKAEEYTADPYLRNNLAEMCTSGFPLDKVIAGYFPGASDHLMIDTYHKDADGTEIPGTRSSYDIGLPELRERCITMMQ